MIITFGFLEKNTFQIASLIKAAFLYSALWVVCWYLSAGIVKWESARLYLLNRSILFLSTFETKRFLIVFRFLLGQISNKNVTLLFWEDILLNIVKNFSPLTNFTAPWIWLSLVIMRSFVNVHKAAFVIIFSVLCNRSKGF